MASVLRLHPANGIVRFELVSEDGYARLGTSLLAELEAQLERCLAERACTGLVIHGSENCFAAGAEIGEVGALSGVAALDFARRGQELFERIARAPKPVVAAVSGYCLGGGLDLALACHWRLASPEALFGHPGASLGLLTGWGGTQRLPRLIGRARALELLLLGEPVDAETALHLGLIQKIVPAAELLSRAVAQVLD